MCEIVDEGLRRGSGGPPPPPFLPMGSGSSASLVAGVLTAGLLVFAAPGPGFAQASDFWSVDTPIALTFEADFRALRNDDRQPNAPLRPASIVVDSSGARVPALIRTRGNYRLKRSTCRYPPLRVRIDSEAVSSSVPDALRGLGNARLVSPCNGNDPDLILLEYLAYRIWILLSDQAYRVRPLQASFVDVAGRDDVRRVTAFALEGDGHLSRRLGIEALSDSTRLVDARALDRDARTRLEIFQYLIGNVDWSITVRHNVFVAFAGDRLVAIPYDFDFSGLVDAPYAAPDPRFGTRSVRDRVFHGACRTDAEFRTVLEEFRAVREAVFRELEALDGLSSRRKTQARRYLEDFYREADSQRILRSFRATCL